MQKVPGQVLRTARHGEGKVQVAVLTNFDGELLFLHLLRGGVSLRWGFVIRNSNADGGWEHLLTTASYCCDIETPPGLFLENDGKIFFLNVRNFFEKNVVKKIFDFF